MGLKLFLRHAFKGSRQAAFGFAPFKVEQLVLRKTFRHHLSENGCLQPWTIMGLKLFLRHAFKGCRQAAFGFAPFKVEQLVLHKASETICLKMGDDNGAEAA